MRRLRIIGGIIVAAAAAGSMSAAFAEHGKVGQWEITVNNEFPGTPKINSLDRERMEAGGIPVPDTRTKHYHHCMTAEEVASNAPPQFDDRNKCTVSNPRMEGQAFAADLTCTGLLKGEGGISVTYDGPEHFNGSARVEGAFAGQPVDMISKFEGTWTSATCDQDD